MVQGSQMSRPGALEEGRDSRPDPEVHADQQSHDQVTHFQMPILHANEACATHWPKTRQFVKCRMTRLRLAQINSVVRLQVAE